MGGYLHALLVQEGAAFGSAPAFVGPVNITTTNGIDGLSVTIPDDNHNNITLRNAMLPAARTSLDLFNDSTFVILCTGGASFFEVAFDMPSGDMQFGADGFAIQTTRLGFYSAPTIAQPTVTGSKAANAALASLMTALAALGLVINNTT